MEHPGERGARLAGVFFYFADRKNRVVRVGLFFDGDHGAGARFLAQTRAESEGDFLTETRSLPTLTRSYPRRFTFYVADPSAPLLRL